MHILRNPFTTNAAPPGKCLLGGMHACLSGLAFGLLAAGSLQAADVNLTASDPINLDSWDEAGRWSVAAAPSGGNSYFTASFQLRTPNGLANDTIFLGGSLTANGGGSIMYKGSGTRTITITNLFLDNGSLINGNSGTTVNLGGNGRLTVETTGFLNSSVDSTDRQVVINCPILGSGTITTLGRGNVQLANTTSPFTGKWVLQGNQTRVASDLALGPLPAVYVADAITLDGGILMNRDSEVTIAAERGITLSGNGGRLQAGWSKYLAINSVITGVGGLTIAGDATPGMIRLNAANSYSGTTLVQNSGWVQVDGSLDANSAVTVQGGGLLVGKGTINGLFTAEANANVGPGGLFSAGTLTLNNAASLSGCVLHVDLADTPGGAHDLLVVNSDLILGGTVTVSVTPLLGTLAPGKYRLINYTGTLTGGAANLVAAPSRYTITFDTTTPGQIDMNVQDGPGANLVWKGDNNVLNLWDLSTPNWLNGANADAFRNGDNVTLDDAGANLLPVFISTPFLANSVAPGSVTVNATKDYTLSGGRLAGPMNLTKKGTGLLILGTANGSLPNYFDGSIVIEAGRVRPTYARALGTIAGGTVVRSGASFDVNGQDLGFEPFTVEGAGADGNGALVNYGGGQNNALRVVTMTGDTTVGGTGRFDIRNVGGTASLSTGSNGYKLTKKGPNQFSLVGVEVDPMLGDINVLEGSFGYETTSTLGDSTKTLTMSPNTTLIFWNLVNQFYKPLVLGGGTAWNINNGAGSSTIVGPVTVLAQSIWNVSGTSLTVSSGVTGAGGITKVGNQPLTLDGENTYAGSTVISAGTVVLGAAGSISNSPSISLASGTTFNVSAAAAGSPSGAFELNGVIGQTLSGSGTVIGNVSAGSGSAIIPGTSAGTLSITGNLQLQDAWAVVELGATTNVGGINDLIAVNGNLALVGDINLVINALGPLDTVNPYTIATYTGTLDTSLLLFINAASNSRYTFTVDIFTPGVIRVYATAIGAGAETLTWQGNDPFSGTIWDINGIANWSNSLALADKFFLGDRVMFDDTASSTTVNLLGTMTPASLTVSNETKDFTWSGPGKLSGTSAILKQGASKLTLANTGVNDNSGATTVSAGTLEVGSGGTAGNLNSAAITNAGTLAFNRSDNITVANVISGTGTVEKKGAGLMILNSANTALNGPVVVSAGTLRAGNASALGTATAGTTVASGATLDVNALNLSTETVTVSGSGVGGAGALYNSSVNAQQQALRNVVMAGDTTFGGISRWDIRSNGIPWGLTGNGYNLTKVGPNENWLVNLAQIGVGNIVINQGILGFEGTTTMGNVGSTLTVNPGATLGFYGNNNGAAPLNKVAVMNTANWLNSVGDNYFSGPVTLNGPNTFNVGSTLRLLGAIDGAGTLIKSSGGTLVLGANNTYSGNSVVQGGVLRVGNGGTSGTIAGTVYNSGRVDIERSDTYTQAFNVVGTGGMGIRSTNGAGVVVWDGSVTINPGGTVEVGRDLPGKLTIQGTANPKIGNLFLGNPASTPGVVLQTGGDVVVTNQLRIGHWATATSTYTLENGTITILGTPTGPAAGTGEQNGVFYVGVDGTGIFTQKGGTVRAHGLVLDNRANTAGDDIYNLQGGTFVVGPSGISSGGVNTYLINLTAGTIAASADWTSGLNMNLIGTAPTPTFDTEAFSVQLSGNLSGAGGLKKAGAGTLTLLGANTYAGDTLISAGTLAIGGGSSLASQLIDVQAGTTLDTSGLFSLALVSGQTLKGNGTVNGSITFGAGSTLSVGASIGAITINNILTTEAGGTNVFELDKSVPTNDLVVANSVVYGGTLVLNNLGPALAIGDSFKLFSATAYSGAYEAFIPDRPATGLAWDTSKLVSDGILGVMVGIPSTPTNITAGVTNGILTVGWPTDYTGWRLEAQTNSIDIGLSSAWVTVPGSTTTNQMSFPIDPNQPTVFFRLGYTP